MKRAVAVVVYRACYWLSIGLAISVSWDVMSDRGLGYLQLQLIAALALIGRGTLYFLGGL